MPLDELIEALRRPEAHPRPVRGAVEVLQTHISVLFLTHDRVYKVKKPVDLGFVDYSTLERREHFCAEEVRLNRRLAPDVYLGVVAITLAPDGTLVLGGDGTRVDVAVEMVRLPADAMLDARLARGDVDAEALDAVVARLVEFHRAAATGPEVNRHATPDELRAQLEENLEGCAARRAGDEPRLSPAALAHVGAWARRELAARRVLVERRLEEGRVREGHGDLHAGNVCLLDGEVVAYDCIEFSARFRCRDVAAEIAFLAMDLDARGERGLGARVATRYAEMAGDPALPELVPFFKTHFALVRAKVEALRAEEDEIDPAERDAAGLEAVAYLGLAASYALPAPLVLTCGLPATGKSTAARAIGRALGAEILRSDVVRKSLAGLAPTERGPAEIYEPAFTARTYAALHERAAARLAEGAAVVVDATLSAAERRAPFVELARRAGVPLVVVHLTCDEATIRARLRERAASDDGVSDAGWSVYAEARDRFEPPDEIDRAARVDADGAWPGPRIAAAVVESLVGRAGAAAQA